MTESWFTDHSWTRGNVAYQAAEAAQTTADAKATTYWQTTAPTGGTYSSGDLWVNTSTGSGQTSYWNTTVTPAAWTPVPVDAGALAASLVLSTRIIAGPVNGTHAEMNPNGFHVFKADPTNSANPPIEVARLGVAATNDYFAITDANNVVQASITDNGGAVFDNLSVDGWVPDANGNRYADSAIPAGSTPTRGIVLLGREFLDWMDDRPRGLIAQAHTPSGWTSPTFSTELGICEIDFTGSPGRNFWFHIDPILVNPSVANQRVALITRITTDGTTPTITSPVMRQTIGTSPSAGGVFSIGQDVTGSFSPADCRILISLAVYSGGGTFTITGPATQPINITVIDMGRDVPDQWIANTGGGTAGTVAPPAKKTYTSVWQASANATYAGNGTKRTDTSDLIQGQDPSGYNGNGWASIVFAGANSTGGETGKTITSALTGATLSKAEIWLKPNHWYYNSGGTAVIRAQGSTSLITTAPSGTSKSFAGWQAGVGQWVDITSIATTSTHGITLGQGPSTDETYYGRFYDMSTAYKPAIRLTYTK